MSEFTTDKIAERLRADLKHNDHFTENPMFCLQILERDTGYDARYADNMCWWNLEQLETVYDDDPEVECIDGEWFYTEDTVRMPLDEEHGWEGPYGYKERWDTVMVSLTQEGIDGYMRQNGHNVKLRAFRGKTRTYVESWNRCEEMIAVRKHLIQGDADARFVLAIIFKDPRLRLVYEGPTFRETILNQEHLGKAIRGETQSGMFTET